MDKNTDVKVKICARTVVPQEEKKAQKKCEACNSDWGKGWGSCQRCNGRNKHGR